jgi:hypothetical protein
MDGSTRQRVTMPEHAKLPASAPVEGATGPVRDIAIAGVVARVVRATPGVVDLSPGLVMPSATYGSRERVPGVVVHHLAPDKIVLEVHVILSGAYCKAVASDPEKSGVASGSETLNALHVIAEQIRERVYAAAQDLPLPTLTQADVLIDDLR